MTEKIRVLITDDHEVVREGLRMILETEDDFEVVGIAVDGVEAGCARGCAPAGCCADGSTDAANGWN